jgi:hypothetical protein
MYGTHRRTIVRWRKKRRKLSPRYRTLNLKSACYTNWNWIEISRPLKNSYTFIRSAENRNTETRHEKPVPRMKQHWFYYVIRISKCHLHNYLAGWQERTDAVKNLLQKVAFLLAICLQTFLCVCILPVKLRYARNLMYVLYIVHQRWARKSCC